MNITRDAIREWKVYKIESPSNRIYIGLTCNFNQRIYAYKNESCIGQPLLYKSLKKYGYSSHTLSIIDEFTSDVKYAQGKEMFWIRTYMSNYSKWRTNGLNLSDGGEGSRGSKLSISTRKKISESRKGIPSPFKGKKWSEEDKKE